VATDKLREIAARVGAISLRERIFVFAAAVTVALALVQTLLVDAAHQRKLNAEARIQGANEMLAQIAQQQALAGQQGQDPDRAAREALARHEARLAELDARLETLEQTLIAPERMNAVLKNVVQDGGGVRVVAFKTLGPQPVAVSSAPEGAPPGFYRHGFEITLSGGYADLVAYLERLEALSWPLNWSEVALDAAGRPELMLTLTVHTLSLEEAWLRV
jgi:MSHA biogenesis protein MshJ